MDPLQATLDVSAILANLNALRSKGSGHPEVSREEFEVLVESVRHVVRVLDRIAELSMAADAAGAGALNVLTRFDLNPDQLSELREAHDEAAAHHKAARCPGPEGQ